MSYSTSLEDKLKEETETLKEKVECINEINLIREKSFRYSKYSLWFLFGSLATSIISLYYLINNQDIYIPIFITSLGLYFGYDELQQRKNKLLDSIEEVLRYKC